MPTPPFEVLSRADLLRRSSLKWQHHGPDVLPAWVAEMDVLLAPEVVQALTAAVRSGDTGYPCAGHRYADAFGHFAEQRWDWQVAGADTTLCADVMTGIRVLVEHLTPPGGRVVIPSPVYPPFAMVARELSRQVAAVGLTEDGRLDVAAIAETLDAGAGQPAVVLLCSPHNPTGVVHTRAELHALAEVAAAHGAHVVSDEVHAPLVHGSARFVPWLQVAESGFVVTSAAKAFNLAGLKAALLVAGPGSRRTLRELPDSVHYGASHLGVVGHSAGYLAEPGWLDAVNANIASNAALLASLLDKRLPGIGYRVPEATYLAWLDCRDLGLGRDPADAFLRHGRVALTPGPPFGPGGGGHARLNLACAEAVLDEAVERMAATVVAGIDP